MKFSVSKEKLLGGLQTVQNVVSTRTTLPILSNVLIHAADGQVRLQPFVHGLCKRALQGQRQEDGKCERPVSHGDGDAVSVGQQALDDLV